jgi:hypothetical protein
LFYLKWVNARPFNDCALNGGKHVHRMGVGEDPVSFAHGRTGRSDDHYVLSFGTPWAGLHDLPPSLAPSR